jgi:HD-GYP domain-containing protein (c-di-GMP phosphodiesterase class II)
MLSEDNKLEKIIRIDSELNKIQDQDILLEQILKVAREVANADAGSIYIVKDGKLHIKYAQNASLQKDLPPGQKLIYKFFTLPINEDTLAGYVAKKKKLVNVEDAYNIPKNAPYSYNTYYDKQANYKTQSILTIPLVSNTNELYGVIQMINKQDENGSCTSFTEEDEELISHFSTNVVIALQRAQMTRAILLRMIKMAELRDPKETGPHVNRVAGYAAEIYERWALNQGIPEHKIERDKDTFRMAAMLHDVGKVAISDVLLKKPARFTPEEYKIMQTHSLHGARLFLNEQSEFDAMARLVALNHHENWDGSGYPGHVDISTGAALKKDKAGKIKGKKGKEISIFGRIVAIADVYDALRCKRVYKEAWTEEEVCEEIKKLSGSKFDPELVDIFFEVYPALQTISDMYSEQEEEENEVDAVTSTFVHNET